MEFQHILTFIPKEECQKVVICTQNNNKERRSESEVSNAKKKKTENQEPVSLVD